MSSKQKIILDVDTGVDDALAILYALRSNQLDVIGITTCFGNVDVDTSVRNTLVITELAGSSVPVYRGADRPLLRPWGGPVPWIHGENGLGDATLPEPTRQPETTEAAEFIAETLRAYPGEVILVPVARMTNVARAFLYDPSLPALTKRIVMMGGAASYPGNVTPVAEANIWGDPEAARIVFQSGAPVTMVGLDVTMKVALTGSDLEHLSRDLPYGDLIQSAVEFYMRAYEETQGQKARWCPLHDPLAVAVAEDPSICQTERCFVDVEVQGELTAGMTVVDRRKNPAHPANAEVCVDVDRDQFEALFRTRLGVMA